MDNIIKKVKTIIDKYHLISLSDKIVVGVSGGPDSMCLLDILLKLRQIYNLEIIVCHINHMIRDEAINDQNYVYNFCKTNNIPCHIKQSDVLAYASDNKLSTEEAGRIIRYDFFNEIFNSYNANKIAVAHNANDRVETLMINLMRGSGMDGLKSIEYSRMDKIIRPILCLSRAEVEEYCATNNLNPAIDLSNFENDYTRNKIRNILIPLIKEQFNPNIISTINNTIEILQNDNDFIEQMVQKEYNNVLISSITNKIIVDISKFNNLHLSIRSRLVRYILENLLSSKKGIEYSHINQIIALIESKISGKRFIIKDKYHVTISFDTVEFSLPSGSNNFEYVLTIPGTIYIDELKLTIKSYVTDDCTIKESKKVQIFDYDALKDKPLKIRTRRIGDYITLDKTNGSKKLKEFFIDKKIPLSQRDNVPLFCTNDEVIWILGLRTTSKYKKQDYKKGVLVIEYEYKL